MGKTLKIGSKNYQMCLLGKSQNNQPTNNGSSITVVIPKENILSCECLKKLMIKVSKEEEL